MTAVVPSQRTRVTILVDNEAEAGLAAEHGFSLWLETGGQRYLFDTGQGRTLMANAKTLGINPALADHLVLSHGHYDHTGGLAPLLHQAPRFDLHCHPGTVHPRYSIRNRQARSLQMPHEAMAALDRFPQERLHWVQRPVLLADTVGLTGPIARDTMFEGTGGPFYLDQSGHRPDPIDDDLALWIRTGKGLIVCVGCAHAGLINTLRQVRRQNEDVRIRAVIGGFHLLGADRERMEQTIDALRQMSPDHIIPCHCTGEEAVASLREAFGKRCCPGIAGMSCLFDRNGPMAASHHA
jgi:7,8-dihydropterin-6-yl-methyl-4-(beta-D-ribofuranosyl)aminobenzene 5'-phosphate synthase